MKKSLRKRMKRLAAVLAVVSLVLTGLPWMPSGIFNAKAADVTSWVDGTTVSQAVKGTGYVFDFTPDATYAAPGTYGLLKFETGPSNAASYNGTKYGVEYKTGNMLTFQVPGNCYVVIGGDNNSTSDIVASSETGKFEKEKQSSKTAGHAYLDDCKNMAANAVPFLYVGDAGSVTLTIENGKSYIAYACIIPADDNIDLTPYEQKTFSMDINGSKVEVQSGVNETDSATITVAGGKTEICNDTNGIIWADLGGAGTGVLTQSMITNVSDNITATVTDNNVINIAYTDTSTKPNGYTLQVKDNSASGVPSANGAVIAYDFKDKSVVSDLYTSATRLSGGAFVESTDKLIKLIGNTGIYYNGSHGIVINNNDVIEVKVAGNAKINFSGCAYTGADGVFTVTGMKGSMTPETMNMQTAADGDVLSFVYTGEAATLLFTYTGGTGYLHSMDVTNEAPETTEHPQTVMPSVSDFGTPDNMEVKANGQKLVISQTGGSMKTVEAGGAIDSSVSYYLFPQTADWQTLSADVVVNTCGGSNYNGVFFGAFDGTNLATIAIRNSTGLRGIYSKKATDMAGAGGTNSAVAKGEKVHFSVVKTDDGLVVSAEKEDGTVESMTFKYNDAGYLLLADKGADSNVYYGFAVANATVTVTNMELKAADDTVLYDQNACYDPLGTAPKADSITAEADASREFITVNWTGDNCDGDGTYILQVSQDGIDWQDVAVGLTEKSYRYEITTAGNFYFRVCGTLGNSKDQIEDNRNEYAAMDAPIYVVAALTSPELEAEADASSVSLTWNAVEQAAYYEVYRYSYDETASGVKKIATTTAPAYKDTEVTAEMPYYYYVKAFTTNAENWSNASNTVWKVPSAGHKGAYAYEDEATKLTITKKSYDTVYKNSVVIEGVASNAGTIYADVNGTKTATQNVKERGTFAFNLTVNEGRNDVNLYFTDSKGTVTRKTFNFVYLTNYDKVVDASYTGTDGAAVNGVATYKTVQAAVDSVAADNSSRVVILVKEGTYVEHLRVNKPNVTLIGEDSEKTIVSYFDRDNLGG